LEKQVASSAYQEAIGAIWRTGGKAWIPAFAGMTVRDSLAGVLG